MGFSLTERTFVPGSLSMSSFAPSVAVFCFSLWIYSPLSSGNWKGKAAIMIILENQTPKKHLQLIYTLLVSFTPCFRKIWGNVHSFGRKGRAVETSIGTEQCNSTVPFCLFCCPVLFPFLLILSCTPPFSSCLFKCSSLSSNSFHFSTDYSKPDKPPNYEN